MSYFLPHSPGLDPTINNAELIKWWLTDATHTYHVLDSKAPSKHFRFEPQPDQHVWIYTPSVKFKQRLNFTVPDNSSTNSHI